MELKGSFKANDVEAGQLKGGANPYYQAGSFVLTNTWTALSSDGVSGQPALTIIYDGTNLWTTNFTSEIQKLDLMGNVLARLQLTSAGYMIYDFGFIWVAGGSYLFKIDPSTVAVVATFQHGINSNNITSNGTYIFIDGSNPNNAVPTALRFDPATEAFNNLLDVAVTPRPDSVVIDGGSNLWIIDRTSSNINRYTLDTNTVLGTTNVSASGTPLDGIFVNGFLWVTMSNGDLLQITTADVVNATYPSGATALGAIATDSTYFIYMAATAPSNKVIIFDFNNLYFVSNLSSGNSTDDVVWDGGTNLWAIDRTSTTILRLNRFTGALLGSTSTSGFGNPRRGIFIASFLWIVTSTGYILKIDPTTDTVVASYRTGQWQTVMGPTNLTGGANAVVATDTIQDIIYTAVTPGAAGNSITIQYTPGATAGSEVVTVVGPAISVQIEDGVSTASQIVTAVLANGPAAALVTPTTGAPTNPQNVSSAATPQPLTGGADAIAATLSAQRVLYTAVTPGAAGNGITVAYTSGGTAGSEVVTVVTLAISVQIQDTVSLGTEVVTAVNAYGPAAALVTASTTTRKALTLEGVSQSNGSTFYISEASPGNLYQFTISATSTSDPISVAHTPDDIAWDTSASIWSADLTSGIIYRLDPTGVVVGSIDASQDGTIRRLGPTLFNGFLWATMSTGTLDALDPYSSAESGANRTSIAFDGVNMWTGNQAGNTAGSVTKVTPAGMMTLYPIGSSNNPFAIAFDGVNMWTANEQTNSVSKITPAGVVTTYPAGTDPRSIAFDGVNMWTANNGGQSVSKITPAGVVTTYHIPGSTNPNGIAFNSATGDMWVTGSANNTVSKVSPTGVVTTYGPTGMQPFAIAYNSVTGDMWTCNAADNGVSKVTPAGVITTYTSTGAAPHAIAFDGTNMWTANSNGNSVTKVTPAGSMTTYSGTGSQPRGIAFDGTNMWVADIGDGTVTKVSPSGSMTIFQPIGHVLETITLNAPTTITGITNVGGVDFYLSAVSPDDKLYRLVWDGGNYRHIIQEEPLANVANGMTFGNNNLYTFATGDPTIRKITLATGAIGATLNTSAYGNPTGITIQGVIAFAPLDTGKIIKMDMTSGGGTVVNVIKSQQTALGGISENISPGWRVGVTSPPNGYLTFLGDGFQWNGTPLTAGDIPAGMYANATDLWLSGNGTNGPTRVNIGSMTVVGHVTGTDNNSTTVVLFSGSLYFNSTNGNSVFQASTITNAVTKTILSALGTPSGSDTTEVYSDGTSLWIGTSSQPALERADSSARIIAGVLGFDNPTVPLVMVAVGSALYVRNNTHLLRFAINLG